MTRFFVGTHKPQHARFLGDVMVSVNTLRTRKSAFVVGDWLLDSGAFTEISKHGAYRSSVEDYASEIRRWRSCGNLLAAVAQDWMCEPFVLERTGHSVEAHQQFTIWRYDALIAAEPGAYVMPVLQGFDPVDYARHLREYGERLKPGAWVGVGSVCKRNGDPRAIEAVLCAIKAARPDLLLHGFGIKATAMRSGLVRACLHSADSMAWSYAARREGRNPNDWREAEAYAGRIDEMPVQRQLMAAY